MGGRLPEVQCAICGQSLNPLGPHFRTTGVFLPAGDALSRYCNVPFHWDCYGRWPQRGRFARCYVEAWFKANRLNPFWWCVYVDQDVYVSANPSPPTEEASVRLFAVGDDIRFPLPRWTEWLADPERVTPDLQPLEREALNKALPALRKRFPNDHAVVDAIDPAEKSRRR